MEQINHTICGTYVCVHTKCHLALKIAATRVASIIAQHYLHPRTKHQRSTESRTHLSQLD
jgi:hypothetical protein